MPSKFAYSYKCRHWPGRVLELANQPSENVILMVVNGDTNASER